MDSLNDMTLAQLDPEIQAVLDSELERQRGTLEMIASENFVPRAVLQAQGSVLTNKYAEGYPGRRYYGGCEFVDVAESLAIERAKQVFGGDYVNVQPHAGAQANAAALMAMANVGDPILGLSLAHGGHLTHGMRLNFSGKHYKAVAYEVDRETMRIEPEKVREAALAERPRVIIAGWSAYPRHLDFQAFRDIADEVGAALWVDMAHFAGLVAAGLHPNPVPYADVVTTTVHKTLGGPRSGMILSSRGEQWGKKLNSAVFPRPAGRPPHARDRREGHRHEGRSDRGVQGPPAPHARGCADPGRAPGRRRRKECRHQAGHRRHRRPPGPGRPGRVRAQRPAGRGSAARGRYYGQPQRGALRPRPPAVTSGLRIGTPALASRGFDAEDFAEVADIIGTTLTQGASGGNVEVDALRARVKKLTDKHPLYAGLEQ